LAAQRIWHARRSGTDLDAGQDPDALAATLPEAPAWAPPSPANTDVEPDDSEEAFDDELADHAERVAAYDKMVRRMGRRPVQTAEQVLDLMVAIGLVEVDAHDGEQGLRLATNPPLPTEALPMTPEERAEEDRLRWQSRYGRLSQTVLQLFIDEETGGPGRTALPATLDRLAASTGADPEDVRHAVMVLINEGDVSAHRHGGPVDVERLEPHQRFDLVLDPDRFYADRMSLRINRPIDRPDS
jgi:hypothetical protein